MGASSTTLLASSWAVAMSFAISAAAKPEPKDPESTNGFILVSVELFRPVEALSVSTIVSGSRPKARPTITASQAATRPAAET